MTKDFNVLAKVSTDDICASWDEFGEVEVAEKVAESFNADHWLDIENELFERYTKIIAPHVLGFSDLEKDSNLARAIHGAALIGYFMLQRDIENLLTCPQDRRAKPTR